MAARVWPPWQPLLSEMIGTGLLLLGGLSLVIIMFGAGSPLAGVLPNHPMVRIAMTGFLFGCIGAAIALSPVGTVSGAHINPTSTTTVTACFTEGGSGPDSSPLVSALTP